MSKLIKRIRARVPKGLGELATLRRKRAAILAYFDTGASNGSVEARLNGRLEHLRWGALRVQESVPLHLEVPDPLGRAARSNQRTPKGEEPLILGVVWLDT